MPLHEVIAARRDEVMSRWRSQVEGTIAPGAMPLVELVDHLPQFLDEVIAALRTDDGATGAGPGPEGTRSAAVHGESRLRLGFSLGAVVREYGVLRDAMIETGRAAGVQITFRELQVVNDATLTGIAQAVTEYALQRDAELLRQANEHFAFIAHELRNPLSSAATAFALLQQRGELPAGSRAVGALGRGLTQLSELIDQTLRIARVASGIELRRQWTTLRSLFSEAELDAAPEADAKEVAIHLHAAGDDRVDVDLRLMRSALGNLLRNAVKYSPGGCAVELRGTVEHGRATIEIEDRCGGLEPGKVEQAFAPFVRLDQQQTGFGLGLAIARQAADAHGGTLRVQNLPGTGCVFILELPVSPPSSPEAIRS
jgi:signal transduction histidine kinase